MCVFVLHMHVIDSPRGKVASRHAPAYLLAVLACYVARSLVTVR